MTVNVKALINNFGQTYEALFDAGYIPYKTKPKGDSGSPRIGIDMAKEAILSGKAKEKLEQIIKVSNQLS